MAPIVLLCTYTLSKIQPRKMKNCVYIEARSHIVSSVVIETETRYSRIVSDFESGGKWGDE
jgi:hypothetical protein